MDTAIVLSLITVPITTIAGAASGVAVAGKEHPYAGATIGAAVGLGLGWVVGYALVKASIPPAGATPAPKDPIGAQEQGPSIGGSYVQAAPPGLGSFTEVAPSKKKTEVSQQYGNMGASKKDAASQYSPRK